MRENRKERRGMNALIGNGRSVLAGSLVLMFLFTVFELYSLRPLTVVIDWLFEPIGSRIPVVGMKWIGDDSVRMLVAKTTMLLFLLQFLYFLCSLEDSDIEKELERPGIRNRTMAGVIGASFYGLFGFVVLFTSVAYVVFNDADGFEGGVLGRPIAWVLQWDWAYALLLGFLWCWSSHLFAISLRMFWWVLFATRCSEARK